MHQLNAIDLPQFSPNDLLSIRQPITAKNKIFWLQYTALLWYMGLEKKTQLALDLHRKKMYSRFRFQYYYDAWDLKKSISLDHHKKNIYFSFRLQC